MDRHIWKVFYNLPTTAFGHRREIINIWFNFKCVLVGINCFMFKYSLLLFLDFVEAISKLGLRLSPLIVRSLDSISTNYKWDTTSHQFGTVFSLSIKMRAL